MADDLERLRLELDSKRIENEHMAKLEELRLREKELDASQGRATTDAKGISAPRATVYAAIATLAGGVIGALINGVFTNKTSIGVESERGAAAIDLEKIKFQTGLILKAIDTRDQPTAVKTLQFFANAGLIPAYEKKVLELASKDEGASIPTIGANAGFDLPSENVRSMVPFVATLSSKSSGGFVCSGLALPGNMVLTADYCAQGNEPYFVSFGGRTNVVFSTTRIVEKNDIAGTAIYEYADPEQKGPQTSTQNVRFRDPKKGEPISILLAPIGTEVKMASKNCSVVELTSGGNNSQFKGPESFFTYRCPTSPGAGGAPLLSVENDVVGIVYASTANSELELGRKGGSIVAKSGQLGRVYKGVAENPK
jgi:hypothetical protein